jgi:lipoprotein-releasing system permease protein
MHSRKVWALALGVVLAGAGALGLVLELQRAGAFDLLGQELGLLAFGWGGPFAGLRGLVTPWALHRMHTAVFVPDVRAALLAGGAWVAGVALLGLGARRTVAEARAPSSAVGAPLYPPLASYQDFYWSTLLAYGGGIVLSELTIVLLQQMLASSRPGHVGLAPLTAFGVSLLAGSAVAFVAGFLGASRARRLAGPEATLAIVYLGLPLPILLTLLPMSTSLQLSLGYRMGEVVYLANLLGRPEVGYWLVFGLLCLLLLLGITTGFVATGSGEVDLRSGFERFIARRHSAVFRPRLLLGGLVVLVLGIIPPLLLYAILRAAEAAVDKTRIKALGQKDPLLAAQALHEAKLKEQSPTAMMTALSVGGVGVGVMALIIVLSVMSGFEVDLQQKILGTNAHAMVLKYGDSIADYRGVMQKALAVKGVTGATPFIMSEVMITSGQNVSGVIVKGIDPDTVGAVTELPRDILSGGSLDNLTYPARIPERSSLRSSPGLLDLSGADGKVHPKSSDDAFIAAPKGKVTLPGVLIGRELAANLRVGVGDPITIVSPMGGELGPSGPMPKNKSFRVAGVFYTGMFEYDSKFAYIRLDEAQKFFKVEGANGVELKVADVDDARRIGNEVLQALDGYPYRVRDWGELNRNLLSALRLEKLVMGIILSIIVIVAAGLIVATVIMLVLEKRKEISVLKALGVPDGGIVKIFLAEGLQIGLAGGLLGLIAGLGWCLFIDKVHLRLDPEVYYIPSLPVKIEPLQTTLAVVIAVLVTYLASIYPALKASRMEPVEGLKAE